MDAANKGTAIVQFPPNCSGGVYRLCNVQIGALRSMFAQYSIILLIRSNRCRGGYCSLLLGYMRTADRC